MYRLVLIVTAFLFGCDSPSGTTQPTARPASATARTTQAVPEPIELRYGIYLARLDFRVTVSAEGVLRSVRTDNKSYGTGDIDPKNERVEVREGKLTAEQIAKLASLFTDWDSLSTTPYGGVADGGDISIRYGDKTVSGGSAVPKQVEDARIHLMELARSMPLTKPCLACRLRRNNVGPITGRAGAEPRLTDRNYTAGPVRCIGGLYDPASPSSTRQLTSAQHDHDARRCTTYDKSHRRVFDASIKSTWHGFQAGDVIAVRDDQGIDHREGSVERAAGASD